MRATGPTQTGNLLDCGGCEKQRPAPQPFRTAQPSPHRRRTKVLRTRSNTTSTPPVARLRGYSQLPEKELLSRHDEILRERPSSHHEVRPALARRVIFHTAMPPQSRGRPAVDTIAPVRPQKRGERGGTHEHDGTD
jgi:hypothetical protein